MKADILQPLELAAWPALWLNLNGTVRRANGAAVREFGLLAEPSQVHLSSIWGQASTVTVEMLLAKMNHSCPPPMELKFRSRGGGAIPFQVLFSEFKSDQGREFILQCFRKGEISGLESRARTEAASATHGAPSETNLDAPSLQKQKLDCALHLARSVSLDFNNALTTILGHTSLVLSQMDPGHSWRNALLEVERSAEKAAEIAQDLADFSRPEKDQRAVSQGNLNDVLRRTIGLFQMPGARPNLHWESEFEARPYSVSFDEAKIQQALVRVLENAVQACDRPATIRVRSRNVEIQAEAVNGSSRVPPGYYVSIEISDDGPGIAPDLLPRVFEPFFTTKTGHRGLGLAWVYGIVTNHGGSVGLQSEPGAGTTVRLLLPAQDKCVRDSNLKVEELFGVQTLLVVDDENMLLTMAEMILPAFGYRVLTAGSGSRAIEILESNLSQIDLVLTDMVMPSMSGRELVEKIKAIAPEVRLLCMSGYVRPQAEDPSGYLQKPFTSQNLLRKVKEALG